MTSYTAIHNVSSRSEARLSGGHKDLLAETVRLAEEHAVPIYLVGGVVRDLILDTGNLDLDLVVEGDARDLARNLANELSADLKTHERFLTATISHGNLRIDLTSARQESYPNPGALPDIQPADLRTDLRRRDFTINTIAADLSRDRFGEVIAPLGGRADLDASVVRTLHKDSFADDATRLLRACRYATRLGFAIEDKTEHLMRLDGHYLEAVSGDRVRHEIERTLDEENPGAALALAESLGILEIIQPGFKVGAGAQRAFARDRDKDPTTDLALLATGLPTSIVEALADRLDAPSSTRNMLVDTARLNKHLEGLSLDSLRDSELHADLSPYPPEALRACHLASNNPILARRIEDFLQRLAGTKSELDGDDLIALGVHPGPRIGQILRDLLRARLDGEIASREEEVEAVKKWELSSSEGTGRSLTGPEQESKKPQ